MSQAVKLIDALNGTFGQREIYCNYNFESLLKVL